MADRRAPRPLFGKDRGPNGLAPPAARLPELARLRHCTVSPVIPLSGPERTCSGNARRTGFDPEPTLAGTRSWLGDGWKRTSSGTAQTMVMLLLAYPPFTNREQITPRARDQHDHDGNPIMGEITTTCAGERTSAKPSLRSASPDRRSPHGGYIMPCRPGAPFPTPGRFLWSCALPLMPWPAGSTPERRSIALRVRSARRGPRVPPQRRATSLRRSPVSPGRSAAFSGRNDRPRPGRRRGPSLAPPASWSGCPGALYPGAGRGPSQRPGPPWSAWKSSRVRAPSVH